jgi:hypothetical protein
MVKLLNIPKKQTGYYVLAALMCVFIVLPIQVPREIGAMIDSNIGKIIICVITLNMFLSHPLIGSIGIIAAYELIRRSAGHAKYNSGIKAKYVPSEAVKTNNLNRYNQFPITVEEIVIKDKIPYSFNISNPSSKASYIPVIEDTRGSVNISNLN